MACPAIKLSSDQQVSVVHPSKRAHPLSGIKMRSGSGTLGRSAEQERPSCAAPEGEGGRDKAKPKHGRAQRESDGVVVPRKTVQDNAVEGRTPALVTLLRGGKRKVMARPKRRVKSPGGKTAVPQKWEKVRKLQWELYRAAKQQSERKFHALWQCDGGSISATATQHDSLTCSTGTSGSGSPSLRTACGGGTIRPGHGSSTIAGISDWASSD